MGSLPAVRVTPGRPFLNTGLDYAGPFSVKISRNKTGKVPVIVCMFSHKGDTHGISIRPNYIIPQRVKAFHCSKGQVLHIILR